MKELFEEQPQEVVEEKDTPTIDLKTWWVGKKCSFCGGDQKLWFSGNGIVRCEKHYRNK